jgi:uncharacterized membrane protein YphA (DoxX/SURF4 family)
MSFRPDGPAASDAPAARNREARPDTLARLFAVGVFALAGGLKLAANAAHLAIPERAPGFASVLQVLGAPLPQVLGWGIPLLEVVGAWCLYTRHFERVAAALLALDMAGAIVTVGIPGLLGRPVRVGELSIGAEPWRLPLEASLLLVCLRIAARKS